MDRKNTNQMVYNQPPNLAKDSPAASAPQQPNPITELQLAFQAIIAPFVNNNLCLSQVHNADHRPTTDALAKEFSEKLAQCETYFNEVRCQILLLNRELDLQLQIETLNQKIKKVDECKSNCLLMCASWKKIMSHNLQLINSSTVATSSQPHHAFPGHQPGQLNQQQGQGRMLGPDHQALR